MEEVPARELTLIVPLAPLPTTALITESETIVKELASVPPKLTVVTFVKFAP